MANLLDIGIKAAAIGVAGKKAYDKYKASKKKAELIKKMKAREAKRKKAREEATKSVKPELKKAKGEAPKGYKKYEKVKGDTPDKSATTKAYEAFKAKKKSNVKDTKADVKKYVGGYKEMDIKLFNTTIAKKMREGEPLTAAQKKVVESVSAFNKGKKSSRGTYSKAAHIDKKIDVKAGDVIDSKTHNFLGQKEHITKEYIGDETDKLANAVYKFEGDMENISDLAEFNKRGQSLMSKGNKFKVKSTTDKVHPASGRAARAGAKGKNYKEIILEQMSEADFNKLSKAAKNKVIKNALSVGGTVGAGAATSKEDN